MRTRKSSNKRITVKERNLLKGAVRRVFSRSDLRRVVVEASIIDHTDNSRPRVKKWGKCAECKKPTPKSYLVVDHILPVVPLDKAFEHMSFDEVIDRMWCNLDNLQAICEECHKVKTKAENKLRRAFKKERK